MTSTSEELIAEFRKVGERLRREADRPPQPDWYPVWFTNTCRVCGDVWPGSGLTRNMMDCGKRLPLTVTCGKCLQKEEAEA